jgi:hypothetical protein
MHDSVGKTLRSVNKDRVIASLPRLIRASERSLHEGALT